MFQKDRKILVISHDASLSGAPVLLLNLCKLLVSQQQVQLYFVIRRDGPLVNEFKKLGPVTVLKAKDYGSEASWFRRVINFATNKTKLGLLVVRARTYNYILSNTIVNGKLLHILSFYKKPIITYVHELENVISEYVQQGDAVYSLRFSDLFAYPSIKVKEVLSKTYNIPDIKLHQLSYYFPFDSGALNHQSAAKRRADFRKKYGIGAEDFLVGSMGLVSDRKGTDLFIEVCAKVVALNPAVKFCWIGGMENAEQEEKIKKLLANYKLEGNVFFTGVLQHDLFNAAPFDVFFLSSREDPYPLVVLEAAIMNIPSICFSLSGGIVEFVDKDAGWIIDGFATSLAAEKVLELATNRSLIEAPSKNAYKKVMERHCNPQVVLKEFESIINALH